eukprot:scaffold10861_cov180-Amphora_coffeaeformis.AAC.30
MMKTSAMVWKMPPKRTQQMRAECSVVAVAWTDNKLMSKVEVMLTTKHTPKKDDDMVVHQPSSQSGGL